MLSIHTWPDRTSLSVQAIHHSISCLLTGTFLCAARRREEHDHAC